MVFNSERICEFHTDEKKVFGMSTFFLSPSVCLFVRSNIYLFVRPNICLFVQTSVCNLLKYFPLPKNERKTTEGVQFAS